jgi:imidazolonepropionase-like amidohydrolase
MTMQRVLTAWFLLVALSALAPSLRAADPPPKPEEQPKQQDEAASAKAEKEEGKEEKKKEEPKDRYFAVKGGVVHTIVNGDLYGVTILAKNGKIHEIGTHVELPEDTEVLDASGYHLYPGLVAVSSGSILGAEPPDDTSDVYSLFMTIGLAGGITTAMTGNTAAKLTYGSLEGMVVKREVFKSLNYSTRSPEARHKLRAAFEKVRQYIRDLEAHEEKKKTDPDAEPPDKEWIKGEYETCLKLMRHEAVAVMTANSAHEILEACALAERYGIQIVIRGATEGWTVASEMARAGVSAIVAPRRQVQPDKRLNRPNGSSIENAAILHKHGVPIAVVPTITAITLWGLAGQDLLHLNMQAAFAVRGGLPDEAALRAITIDAARILGIDHRVGSIEVGKDADFAVWDGDLMHYMTHVRWAVVNGRVVYDKQKESLYDHIRPGGDRDAPPPDDYWPRRLGADQ